MMIDVDSLYHMYAEINPRDRKDATWYASEDTLRELVEETRRRQELIELRGNPHAIRPIPLPFTPYGNTLFGRPIEVDDNLPYGVFNISAETEIDRVIRRADRDGVRYTLLKTEPITWVNYAPPPNPTLKALVRKWMGRFR